MNTVFFPAVTATAPVERTRTQTGPIPFSTRVDSVGLTRPHVIQIELPKAASGPYAAGCVAWSPSPLTRANAIAPPAHAATIDRAALRRLACSISAARPSSAWC